MVTRYLPGDILSRRKGLVMHRGIALRGDRVLHNTPLGGEHITTVAEFAQGHRLQVERLERLERLRTLSAADAEDRRGYNLFTNNCEHTVSRARTGDAESPQLKSWALGIGIGAAAFALTRHPGAAAAGYAFGRLIAKRVFE